MKLIQEPRRTIAPETRGMRRFSAPHAPFSINIRHDLFRKQPHGFHDLLVGELATSVEPADKLVHAKSLFKPVETLNAIRWVTKNGDSVEHLVVGHLLQPLLQFLHAREMRQFSYLPGIVHVAQGPEVMHDAGFRMLAG